MFFRLSESVNRPLAVKEARVYLGVLEKALNSWPDTRPWLREELKELAEEVKSANSKSMLILKHGI